MAEPQSLIGQTVSHYRILEKLGGGGMGVVFKAEDTRLKRLVALKFLPTDTVRDPIALERFRREAEAASALNHPNICTIHDIGEVDGQPFIVMELLEGQTLKQYVANGQTSLPQILELGIEIANGLEAAHSRGIVHRDIKPANLFVTSLGGAKILDFGLAKLASASEGKDVSVGATLISSDVLTTPGMAIGTIAFMSPEQVRGEELDGRSDLFSFGLVLYEMVAGRPAFSGKTAALITEAILNRTPTPLHEFHPELPSKLEDIITKCLEKDRSLRYQHASDVRTDLQRLKRDKTATSPLAVESANVQSRATKTNSVVKSNSRRARWLVLSGVAALFIVAAVAGWIYFRRRLHALTDKDTIVIADFANNTGDSVFDDTLRQALSVDLGQSPFLNILSDEQLHQTLREMTRKPGERLTPDMAREVCERTGSKAYLAGSIAALGSEYVVGLKAVGCLGNSELAVEQTTAASKEQVLPALSQLAIKLRKKLGESLSSVRKFDAPLVATTTNSLEALRAYTVSRRVGAEKGSVESIPYLKHAIELDPNFAMAYNALGSRYYGLAEATIASEYFKKAFDLRDGVTEPEKLFISYGYYTYALGDLEKSNEIGELWEQTYPHSWFPRSVLGINYLTLGQYDKSAVELREVIQLAPKNSAAYENLALVYLNLNRFGEAKATIQDAFNQKFDGAWLHLVLYYIAFAQGDDAEMGRQFNSAVQRPSARDMFLAAESDTSTYSGKLNKARELMEQLVRTDRRNGDNEAAGFWRITAAVPEAFLGDMERARRTATAALALAPRARDVETNAALTYALANDATRAQPLIKDLEERFPQDTLMQAVWLPTLRAQLETNYKKPVQAIATLQVAAPYELATLPSTCLYPIYVRAQAYLSDRQGAAAAAEFQKILDHRGLVSNCVTGALAHLGLGRAYVLSGDTVKARGAYQDFLTLWKDADPDIAILKQVKAEYARLH
jgi:serine/threonine protein kinase/tetratricopeptide (TPR) repeat protein